jgi:DNA-binding transcriptional regulator YiaG
LRYLIATESLELTNVEKEIRRETKLTIDTLSTALGLPTDKVDQSLVEK